MTSAARCRLPAIESPARLNVIELGNALRQ
jgi:hypothetical protein